MQKTRTFTSLAEMEAEAEASGSEALYQHVTMNRLIKQLLESLDEVDSSTAVGASIGLFYNLLANNEVPQAQRYSLMHHLLDRFEKHFGDATKEPTNH